MQRVTVNGSGDGLTEALDAVASDREGVVKRPGRDAVVFAPLGDYEAPRETVHLMRSPANSRRLLDAMERLESRWANSTT